MRLRLRAGRIGEGSRISVGKTGRAERRVGWRIQFTIHDVLCENNLIKIAKAGVASIVVELVPL
jgi:hypothetical protein